MEVKFYSLLICLLFLQLSDRTLENTVQLTVSDVIVINATN